MKKLVAIFTFFLFCTLFTNVNAQDILDFKQFNPDEMKSMWKMFENDKDFKALVKEVDKKGFKKIDIKEAAWGYKGRVLDENGKSVDVLFCAYDYYNPKAKKNVGQGCSMIWRKVGNEIYKAYIIFPEGEKNMSKALDGAQEWFAENGKVQVAHSWRSCFNHCISSGDSLVDFKGPFGKIKVNTNCKLACIGAVAVCGGVTAVLAAATGGLGVPAAAAIFFGCAGVSCGTCLAACALGCR